MKKKVAEKRVQKKSSSSERQQYKREWYQRNKQKVKEQKRKNYKANRDIRLDAMKKYNEQYHKANRDSRLDAMKNYYEANRDVRLDAMKNYDDAHREEIKHAKKICQERKKNIVESTRVNFTNTDSSHRIEMEPGEGVDRHFNRHQDCPEANTFLNHITTYKNHFTGNPENNPDEYKILRDQIRGQHISPEKQRDVAQKFLLSQDRGCEWAEESLGKKMFVDGQSKDNLILGCACCGYRSLDNGYTKQPLSELSILINWGKMRLKVT